MAGMSKISAVFDANTTGFVAGTQRVSAALNALEKNVASMRGSLGTLTAIQGAQLFGSLAGLASQAGGGLLSMARSAADSVDALSKLAERAGMAYSEIAGLQYAGDLAGVGIDSIANALTKADKVFVGASAGSKQAEQALATIGLSFEKLQGQSSAERFESIADALAAMPNTAERTAAAIALFGKSGAGLLPMFNEGAAGLRRMKEEADKFGLGLTTLQGKDVEAMNDSFTRAGTAIQGVVTQVVAQLAPGVERVVNKFADFVRDSEGVTLGAKIAEGLYQGADYLAGIADGFLAQSADVWDFAQGVAETWAATTGIFSKALSGASAVFNSFSAIGSGIGAVLSYATAKMLEAAANIAQIIPGGEGWEKNLRQLAAQSSKANQDYLAAAKASTDKAMTAAGNVLGLELGDAVGKATKPTVGTFQQLVREGKAAALEAAASGKNAAGQVGNKVSIEVQKAVSGIKLVSGKDQATVEGYADFLKTKFGGGANEAEERTAEATERTADGMDELASKLDFRVVGMV